MLFIVLLAMIVTPVGLWLAYRWYVGEQVGPIHPSSDEILSHVAAGDCSEASLAAWM